jgi:hypothetical protein
VTHPAGRRKSAKNKKNRDLVLAAIFKYRLSSRALQMAPATPSFVFVSSKAGLTNHHITRKLLRKTVSLSAPKGEV